MISFALPWLFGVAMAAALGITALHFLSVRQPRVMLLPTARFVPEREARAVARQARPSDVALLLLRVLALLAAGAALAGARCGAPQTRLSTIIVIDEARRVDSAALVSRAVAAGGVRDVADAWSPTVLWVDGVANDPGVAIAAAIRESARQAQANASLAELSLAVVMPETVGSREGWDAWRSQWPARIHIVRSARANVSTTGSRSQPRPGTVRVVHAPGAVATARGTDIVDAAFAARGSVGARGALGDSVDVVVFRSGTHDRGRANSANANSANANSARVTILWPVSGVPAGWTAAPAQDSVSALVAAGTALVAPWLRTALPPALSDSVRALAWWSDGVAAAVERQRGPSCVREVAIAVPEGDLLLSPAADGLMRALYAPCGGRGVAAPRDGPTSNSSQPGLAALSAYAPASRFRDGVASSRATRPAWLATALLALALVALLVEHVVRRASSASASAAVVA